MKILITGGAGFIPSSLADSLLKDPGTEVVLLLKREFISLEDGLSRIIASRKRIEHKIN